MSHAHSHENTVPRPALAMALALVGVSLVMTTAVRLGLAEREAVPAAERAKADVGAAETRKLSFSDRADGAVVVTDATSGETVATIVGESGNGGFVRGVLRSFARERHMRGIGAAPPFALTLWTDGSLSLADDTTGRSVELGSFGPDNRAAFMRFLAAKTTP